MAPRPEEIQKLMDELRQATDDYIRMLAERGETRPGRPLHRRTSKASRSPPTRSSS